MKKLITICLIIVTTFTVNAQTKEETVSFIAKYMKEAEGLKTYEQVEEKRVEEDLYEQNVFSADKIFSETASENYEEGTYNQTISITNLAWQNVESIVLDTIPSLFHEDDVATVTLKFSTKAKEIAHCQSGTYNVSCDQTYYRNAFSVVVPSNQAVACKKAFWHLVKLYKEENKDPFQT